MLLENSVQGYGAACVGQLHQSERQEDQLRHDERGPVLGIGLHSGQDGRSDWYARGRVSTQWAESADLRDYG